MNDCKSHRNSFVKRCGNLKLFFRLLAIFLSFLYIMDFNTMMQHIIKKKKQFALVTLRQIYNVRKWRCSCCNHTLARKCVTWASSNTNAHELHHRKHPQASIRALRKAQDPPSWFVNFSSHRLSNFVIIFEMGNSAIFSISRQLMELIQNCKCFIWEV